MAVHHLTVTLTGAAQPLSVTNSPSINACEVHIQNPVGNGTVYVGGAGVTSTNFGEAIVAGASAPTTLILRQSAHRINLASTYVIGTISQKINVLYIQ